MTSCFVFHGLIGGMRLVGGDIPAEVSTEELVVQEASAATNNKTLRLRVYRGSPKNCSERLPCVLCVHGSAFYGGRFDEAPLLLPRAQKNVIVLCEHRGSREGGQFPNALHDVAACVRHVRANAADLGIDPKRIAIFGDSSGAYMATMICALTTNPTPQLTGNLGKYPSESAAVTCAIALFPPTKFDVMDEQHDPNFHAQIHNSPESPEAHFMGFPVKSASVDHASPLTYITPHTPPIFLAHGNCDPLVPCGQSRLLFELLVTRSHKPASHQYHEIDGAGHSTAHFSESKFGDLVNSFLDAFNEPHNAIHR